MLRKWSIQFCWNPWLSFGLHFDHTDPSITIHLPLLILSFGRLKQPGFRRPPIISAYKLRLLANWINRKSPGKNQEVQNDLRRLAKEIERGHY